ncbi:MAG: mevalonate kinase [Verrucomicrobiales bacterium]
MIIRTVAYPRAGLVGNPSDGYFGKTISFAFRNFEASMTLWESPELELLPSRRDHSVFENLASLHNDVKKHGYYGGFRLLKASAKRFLDYCRERGIQLDDRNFTLRYSSNIPNQVGLAGSSALITACVRALMGFYNVTMSRHSLANLVLEVENQELGIPAGLQDRVSQAYQGLVFMNFDRSLMESRGYGEYEPLDVEKLPPMYIAYREDLSEGTEVFHNDLRMRWNRGDEDVVQAMDYWASLTVEFRDALQARDVAAMHKIINANFDKRSSLYDVGEGNREMVATARKAGASANFAGSGGAIAGICESDEIFESMLASFAPHGIRVIRPDFAPAVDPAASLAVGK